MPKQILLVDDSVTIHRVVEITFAHEDFAVTAVKSVDEGLDRARQLKPDCVLADAGLAGKTGYDLCGAMRADGALGKIPCLILTGNFTPYDEQKGSSSGADGFVVKPFETQGLIDKVKDAIARRSGATVPAAAPAAAAPSPIPVAAKAGIESLGKPLSTVAAETSARITPQQPARPAPMPVPAAPVAAASPPAPVSSGQPPRPMPKATLMGIPAVNPAMLPPAAPTAAPVTKPAPPSPSQPIVVQPPKPAPPSPSQPIAVAPPAPTSQPIRVVEPPPSQPIRVVEAPKPAPPPPPQAAAHPTTLPHNVPQMPRPPLVPGVATPRAVDGGGGIGDVVRQAAERAAAAVPAKIAAAGVEYEAIAKLSREVIEQVVWEVVPELAETIIRQELDRLVRERQNV